jgi:hypothetical protein
MPRWINSAWTSRRRSTRFSKKRRRVSSDGFALKPAYARVFALSDLDRRSSAGIGVVGGTSAPKAVGGVVADEATARRLVVVKGRTAHGAPRRTVEGRRPLWNAQW